MAQNYDVVVVGAGAAGVFMAYEFVKLDKNIKVCIIDQGGPVSKRKCPIDGKKLSPAFTARYAPLCTASAVQAECRTANIT